MDKIKTDILELFPVKLVGGFITVDYHIGCRGCSFCLSRRHKLWRKIYARNFHTEPDFITPEMIYNILTKMKSFYKAKVPVRFGHNTDAGLQSDYGTKLFSMFEDSNPFIYLTRNPMNENIIKKINEKPNFLLKMTITPPSKLLNINNDVIAIIKSIRNCNPENIFVLIGPLVKDNISNVRNIIRMLPKGVWLDIKPLTTNGIPGLKKNMLPDQIEIENIRAEMFQSGYNITDYYGCVLRKKNGRGFYKARIAGGYVLKVCNACSNRKNCFKAVDKCRLDKAVRKEAEKIGIILGKNNDSASGTFEYEANTPVSRGDETYLSELFNYEIKFTSIIEGSQGGSFALEYSSIQKRWQNYGMFQSDEVYAMARNIYDKILIKYKKIF